MAEHPESRLMCECKRAQEMRANRTFRRAGPKPRSAPPGRLSRGLALSAAVLCVLAAVPGALRAAAPAALVVYDDQLENGFANWSWGTVNLAETAVVHSGADAISFTPADWSGLFLHRDAGIDPSVYSGIQLWIYGTGGGHQSITVALTLSGNPVGQTEPLAGFVAGGAVPAGSWALATIPFASLGVTATSPVFDGFWLQDATGGNQAPIYVDDVALSAWATPPPPSATVTVAVDPAAGRLPISPLIYGVNFGDDTQAAQRHWPARRWGGNATTRYNWQLDDNNHASDWFFENIANAVANVAALPDGTSSDDFIDTTRASGGQPLITVPTIGWTPIDRTPRWGFSVAKYGAQQQTECTATGNASWCNPDAGNGVHTDGTPVTGNDPTDTSSTIGPAFVTGWMAHNAQRTGTAAAGGVSFYALDNEPALWNSTHRDVHPNPLTYDELWQRTSAYAAAIKAQDPGAQVFGPAEWGWCGYFFSAADGCSAGADAAAHGGEPLLDWYLDQINQYQAANGVKLLDYLDLHYYPQSTGVALSDDESAATSALRLRSLKSLYDPTYVDESWIGQVIELIPRMHAWVTGHLPGTKIAISEYNWGNDTGLSSALAQAEALAIFGREGVDLATRWEAPAPDTPVEDAFLLYLNYDAKGSQVSGDSVQAVSSNVDQVGAYAVMGPANQLFLLLFNKDTTNHPVSIQVASGWSAPVALYGFDGNSRLGAATGTAAMIGGALNLTLVNRSATLAVVAPAPAPATPSRFYTLTPCRVLDTRNPTGPFGAPALSTAERTFNLAGVCGVPATAQAVSANLTVVSPTSAGDLRSYAAGSLLPIATAISFIAGQTCANNAVLALSQDGNAALEAAAGVRRHRPP
jgi:Glycoside hydrolase family 44